MHLNQEMLMKLNFLFFFLLSFSCTVAALIERAHLAGSWYPKDKEKLIQDLDQYFSLAAKKFPVKKQQNVNALIVPHAGYRYSGLCAASAYQTIKNKPFERVIIIGPDHGRSFYGIALPDYTSYETPLGLIPADTDAVNMLAQTKTIFKEIPNIWKPEHSVEIQLPFLQASLQNFSIVPLITGKLTEQQFTTAAKQLGKLVNDGKKTLIVVSSDFIHYGKKYRYTPGIENAKKFDTQAIKAIVNESYKDFNEVITKTGATICGKDGIKLLLKAIELNTFGHANCDLVCFYNSKQITGNQLEENFVSYAGIVCASNLTLKEEQALLKLAKLTITEKLFPETKKTTDWFVPTKNMEKPLGLFVTLKTKDGKLRGCIGRITTDQPLYKAVQAMAQAAAFHDSRFAPLQKNELPDIKLSITILSAPKPAASYKDIVLGKHGIILEKDGKTAVYLPQVAKEQKWNRTQTLQSLSQKAGLAKNAWKNAHFKVFEGFEFGEKHPL